MPEFDRLDRIEMAIERLTSDVQQNTEIIRALAQIAETTLDSIKRLETVARAHEQRIKNLEG